MAVIKVFDSRGSKTIALMGNAMEQEYDEPFDETLAEMQVEEEEN